MWSEILETVITGNTILTSRFFLLRRTQISLDVSLRQWKELLVCFTLFFTVSLVFSFHLTIRFSYLKRTSTKWNKRVSLFIYGKTFKQFITDAVYEINFICTRANGLIELDSGCQNSFLCPTRYSRQPSKHVEFGSIFPSVWWLRLDVSLWKLVSNKLIRDQISTVKR